MTPLIEVMAKAYVDDGDHYISDAPRITWADLKHDQKRDVCRGIKRALLALAECDFKGPHLLPDEAFKARLRAIANEKETGK